MKPNRSDERFITITEIRRRQRPDIQSRGGSRFTREYRRPVGYAEFFESAFSPGDERYPGPEAAAAVSIKRESARGAQT